MKKAPTELELGEPDTDFPGAFLSHLKDQRGNDARTPARATRDWPLSVRSGRWRSLSKEIAKLGHPESVPVPKA